jgi:hypothetical protein
VKRQRRHRRVTFEDETASLANSMTKNLPNMSLQRSIELSSMSKSCTGVRNNGVEEDPVTHRQYISFYDPDDIAWELYAVSPRPTA